MQGSPLIGAAIIVAILALMVLPLRKLTAPSTAAAAAVAATPASAAAVPVRLELESSHAPFSFEIVNLGRVLWKGEATARLIMQDVKMEFPKEGVDLHVTVEWPGDAGREAVKLSVTANDTTSEKTLWGEKKTEDVLSFP